MTQKGEPPRLEGVHYATGDKWRAIVNTNSSRKNEVAGPKPLWMCLVVKVKFSAIRNNIA